MGGQRATQGNAPPSKRMQGWVCAMHHCFQAEWHDIVGQDIYSVCVCTNVSSLNKAYMYV